MQIVQKQQQLCAFHVVLVCLLFAACFVCLGADPVSTPPLDDQTTTTIQEEETHGIIDFDAVKKTGRMNDHHQEDVVDHHRIMTTQQQQEEEPSLSLLSRNICFFYLASADTDQDDYLSQDEFVWFANQMTGNAFEWRSFSRMPPNLRIAYATLAFGQSSEEIFIFGARDDQTADEEQFAALIRICVITGRVFLELMSSLEDPPTSFPQFSPQPSSSSSSSPLPTTGEEELPTTTTSLPLSSPSSQPSGADMKSEEPSQQPSQSSRVPSFLFLLVDDVGWTDFSYNRGNAFTPNIDEWTRRSGSRVLHDFHSGGTVCSPTRATVLTGRNHFRDCVSTVYSCNDNAQCQDLDFEFAPRRTFTVADAVQNVPEYNEGCGVYFAGKWHLGNFYEDAASFGGITSSPTTHGFQKFLATIANAATRTTNCFCDLEDRNGRQQCELGHYGEDLCPRRRDCCTNYWYDDPMAEHGVSSLTEPTPASDAHYVADSFIQFLADRSETGLPFLAQISFRNCHRPFMGSQQARDDCANGVTCRPPRSPRRPYTFEELDYYACLTELDSAVGEILDALDQEGYYNSTMVWLASDNGPEADCKPLGICTGTPQRPMEGPGTAGPLRGRKRDVYEGGHRVPGIVSFPDLLGDGGPREIWETASTLDFLPTIMDLLDIERPIEQQSWAMDGRSILPILNGGRWEDTAEGLREIGFGFSKSGRMLGWGYRWGPWKYVLQSVGCTSPGSFCRNPQLYNLDSDIGERVNLANSEPSVLEEMEEKLENWIDSLLVSRRVESQCSGRAPWV